MMNPIVVGEKLMYYIIYGGVYITPARNRTDVDVRVNGVGFLISVRRNSYMCLRTIFMKSRLYERVCKRLLA